MHDDCDRGGGVGPKGRDRRASTNAVPGADVPIAVRHGLQSNALLIPLEVTVQPPGPNPPPGNDQTGPGSAVERSVFDGINEKRRQAGVQALVWSEELATAARAHSQAMADRGFFSHVDPVRGGLQQRLAAAGISCAICGENIFKSAGFADAGGVATQGWMNSDPHRQNILNRSFTRTGVGVATARDGTVYITQIFGA